MLIFGKYEFDFFAFEILKNVEKMDDMIDGEQGH